MTSHRQQELCVVLGEILDQQLQKAIVHSTILCNKCFNLIDDIDSLEEQVMTKKQVCISFLYIILLPFMSEFSVCIY